ncbi:hypothetical protein C1A40_02410 [Tamlana carrageenivorans]|uniref:Uncharacterized protein n=2 Tax=Pseudotamlana carrageenivorans TaxID=2069432 RepID=A0A2I7SER7_9FLAO|nr:hypothetical protein C1A40_02410 [Tamlana carrageenivorans]
MQKIKKLIENLEVKLTKIYHVKVQLLKKQITFLADISIINTQKEALNVETIGLVTLKRVLFYDTNSALIGEGIINISSVTIDPNKNLELKSIPFTANMATGLTKLQSFLKNPESQDVFIELELEAFNKVYKTRL